MAAGQPEGALMGRSEHGSIAALGEPVAPRPEPVATPASASPGEVDAALALSARLEPSEIEIAILGAILASAAMAEKLAANLPVSRVSLATAGVGTRAERLIPQPHRPVFKPTLVSSSQREPDDAARPPSRP